MQNIHNKYRDLRDFAALGSGARSHPTATSPLCPDPEGLVLIRRRRRGRREEGHHFAVFHHAPLPRVRRAHPAGRVRALPGVAPARGRHPPAGHQTARERTGPATRGTVTQKRPERPTRSYRCRLSRSLRRVDLQELRRLRRAPGAVRVAGLPRPPQADSGEPAALQGAVPPTAARRLVTAARPTSPAHFGANGRSAIIVVIIIIISVLSSKHFNGASPEPLLGCPRVPLPTPEYLLYKYRLF